MFIISVGGGSILNIIYVRGIFKMYDFCVVENTTIDAAMMLYTFNYFFVVYIYIFSLPNESNLLTVLTRDEVWKTLTEDFHGISGWCTWKEFIVKPFHWWVCHLVRV